MTALMTGMANTEHLPVFIQANDRHLSQTDGLRLCYPPVREG